MATPAQKPLELILARNFLSSISTPAFLVNQPGDIVFFNEAAGMVLGRRFEETGPMPAQEWVSTFGPLGDGGDPLPVEEQPLTAALRANRPAHAHHRIRSTDGADHDVEVSAIPILGADRFVGAMVFFWPLHEEDA